MSRIYYVCANEKLEECLNPYVQFLSIKEALEKGIVLDKEILEEMDIEKKNPELQVETGNKVQFL